MGKTMTSRELNQDVSAAKRAAQDGPVTITDHGRRSLVLMTADDFDRLMGRGERLGDRLWRGQDPAVDFESPERTISQRVVEL
ncbi:MAG: type II toxin-antitoxin system prevent-host-death family antitoxin [Actinobacteria bacterium]|nr:type II toxin-antitoxin system prevent-host-death family antitoxin [Actinomycetota bacterium]